MQRPTWQTRHQSQNGSFDASVYAKALEKGAPLSGPAKVIGEFAASFPRAAKMPQKIGGETIGLGDVVMGVAKAMVSDNWLWRGDVWREASCSGDNHIQSVSVHVCKSTRLRQRVCPQKPFKHWRCPL